MVEERTGELAPPTIFVNFAEVKRYTKTLSRACEIAAFTPEKKTLYNKSLMNERDILAQKEFAVNEALLKGHAEGEIKGREAEKWEIAKGLLKEGVSIDIISKVTGLSEEELQRLINKLEL